MKVFYRWELGNVKNTRKKVVEWKVFADTVGEKNYIFVLGFCSFPNGNIHGLS